MFLSQWCWIVFCTTVSSMGHVYSFFLYLFQMIYLSVFHSTLQHHSIIMLYCCVFQYYTKYILCSFSLNSIWTNLKWNLLWITNLTILYMIQLIKNIATESFLIIDEYNIHMNIHMIIEHLKKEITLLEAAGCNRLMDTQSYERCQCKMNNRCTCE